MAENTKIEWRGHKFDIRQCKVWTKEDSKKSYALRMGAPKGCPKQKKAADG
jgi:hypothetical protein